MRPIDLIFELVYRFVPMDQNEYAKLRDEATRDVATWHPEHENKFKAAYAKYTNHWMARLGLAVAYVPLVKYIGDFMNSSKTEQIEE
jgi:hypothetical protein